MSKRSQEKRRARAKEKKLHKRRMMGTSPLGRLAGDSGACECWVSYQSEDNRMRSLHVFRPARGGSHVAAFFLIDYDCIGLKDAFYRLDVDIGEMREMLRERSRQEEDLKFVKIPVEEAQKMVAGAIKWTREHPYFRVPAQLERCLKILGGPEDIESADVSEFGKDGALLYVGRRRDLEKRLVNMTVREFMDMEGVEVVFHLGDETFREEEFDEDWDEDDPERPLLEEEREEMEDTEEEFEQMQERFKAKMLEGVRKWCFANARAPEAKLESAVELMLAASAEGLSEEGLQAQVERSSDAKQVLMEMETEEDRAAIAAAQKQLAEYVETFGSVQAMASALGMEEWGHPAEEQEEEEQEDRPSQERFNLFAQEMTRKCISAVREWCQNRGIQPEQELERAARIRVAGLIYAVSQMARGESTDNAMDGSADVMAQLTDGLEKPDRKRIWRALRQIAECPEASPDTLIKEGLAQIQNAASHE